MNILRCIAARALFLPTLCWNLLLCRLTPARRWWDRVDEHVLIGALPFSRHVPALEAAGVRAVVNMCEEYRGPQRAYAGANIVQLRLPTCDFTPPSLEHLERGVAFIREQAQAGHSVYVHCKAGRGRSATLVVCWLIDAKGMTPQQAQETLRQKRPHVNRGLSRLAVVREFAARRQRGD